MQTQVSAADAQESLEATIKGEVLRMYQEVADEPDQEFHFFHGREAAERFGYDPAWLDRAPAGAVASFAGVGNPHERSDVRPGETVLDLGSGAGLDAIIAGWQTGPTGRVIGVDLNPTMCRKATANAGDSGASMECHEGRIAAFAVHRERSEAVGELNRRRSPGRRDVPTSGRSRFRTRAVGRRARIQFSEGVHAERGRGVRCEGRDLHRPEAAVEGGSTST